MLDIDSVLHLANVLLGLDSIWQMCSYRTWLRVGGHHLATISIHDYETLVILSMFTGGNFIFNVLLEVRMFAHVQSYRPVLHKDLLTTLSQINLITGDQ